jgi:membrane protein
MAAAGAAGFRRPGAVVAVLGRIETALLTRLRATGRFVVLVARQSAQHAIAVEAAALAFSTVLALIPLLAAFLFIGKKVFDEYPQRILNILREVLPYSETALLGHISDFLVQAEAIRGPGMVGFVVVALIAFSSVEDTLNRIWNVDTSRSLRVRAGSLFLLLLFGPLLIGAVYSVLIVLRARPAFEAVFEQSWLLQSLPFFVTWFGLTMLYWLVPHAPVRFRCALAGGFSAALLLEFLRRGFHLYLEAFPGMSLVYGGFALALIFMTSLHAAWLIVMVGSEIAYVIQHFAALSRRVLLPQPPEGRWLALAAVALLAERSLAGSGAMHLAHLASRLEVPAAELRRALRPLLDGGVLTERRRGDGLQLAQADASVPVGKVLGLYEERRRDVLPNLPPGAAHRLEVLREHLARKAQEELGTCTLAELLALPTVEPQPPADRKPTP